MKAILLSSERAHMAEEAKENLDNNDQPGSPRGEPSQQASGAEDLTEQLRARLREAEASAASLRDKEKERKRKQQDAQKKKEEAEALARGEHEKVIEELRKKVEEQEAIVSEYNKAADERIEAEIKRLPEHMRKEVAFVREQGMSRDKLESFLRMKLESVAGANNMAEDNLPGPPAPSAAAGQRQRPDDPLHENTKELMNELMAPETVYEIGRQIGSFDVGGDGEKKFRFMATGNDNEDTRRWIRFVQATAIDPWRAQREERLKRVKELRNKI